MPDKRPMKQQWHQPVTNKPSMTKPRKIIVFFLTMLIFRLFLSSTTIKNLDLHCQEIFITTTKHDNGVSFHTHRQGYSESRPFRRVGNTIHSSTLRQKSTNINNQHLLECTLVQHSVNYNWKNSLFEGLEFIDSDVLLFDTKLRLPISQ